MKQATSAPSVRVNTLLVSSSSWDGAALPAYPAGRPELSILRYTLAPHTQLPPHVHHIINCGVVISGQLTVVALDGTERTFGPGEALIEMCDRAHYGENRGDTPVDLIMFYAGTPGLPLKGAVASGPTK